MIINCLYFIDSCNIIYNTFIYLTCKIFRAMDFLVALFQSLIEHDDWSLSQACTESYNETLKKWHGWLASSSFTVMFFRCFVDIILKSLDRKRINFIENSWFILAYVCKMWMAGPWNFAMNCFELTICIIMLLILYNHWSLSY